MKLYVLDTDICIYWLNGKESIRTKIEDVGTDGLSITVITYAELRYGAYNSQKTEKNIININNFLIGLSILPLNNEAADKFAKIKIKDSTGNHFSVSAPNLNLHNINFQREINESQKEKLNLFLNIFSFIQQKIETLKPCSIEIDTDDFYFESSKHKLGLGSSAAMTVGLIDSIYKFNEYEIRNKEELFEMALQAHFEAQGKTGSGIDIAASAFGGVGIYSKTEKNFSFKHIKLPQDLYVIPIWTGSSTSTPQFVSKTKQLKIRNSDKYNQIMDYLSKLSRQGCDKLSNNNSFGFMDIVSEYFSTLDNLGKSAGIPIISDVHKEIAGLVKSCYGFYKPSGAGGSDIGIAFTNDKKIKKKIIEKINNSQYKYIKLDTFNKS